MKSALGTGADNLFEVAAPKAAYMATVAQSEIGIADRPFAVNLAETTCYMRGEQARLAVTCGVPHLGDNPIWLEYAAGIKFRQS